MIQREISTNLFQREEIFKVLALGESTGLPTLLIGDRGTAKTQAVLDYVGRGSAYMIQTSMGTRPNDIRGFMDMDTFLQDKKFRTISPITEAECIVVDEIDKTNDAVRDMLLSVMRERKLMLGSEGVKNCRWKLFVGACNAPPSNTPFWDRFIIRKTVERISPEHIAELFTLQRHILKIPVLNGELVNISPTQEEKKVLDILLQKSYEKLSDRTIAHLPTLLRGIQMIWAESPKPAGLRLASLLDPMLVAAVSRGLGIQEGEVA